MNLGIPQRNLKNSLLVDVGLVADIEIAAYLEDGLDFLDQLLVEKSILFRFFVFYLEKKFSVVEFCLLPSSMQVIQKKKNEIFVKR